MPAGFSLWLMPSGEVNDKLHALISQLSKRYNTPDFEPHATLIGSVLGFEDEIVQRTAQLASLVRPYRIELGRVEHLDKYFRCLFLRARESDEVMRANQEARSMFGRGNDRRYMPHLSLMYGNLLSQTKKGIIAEIGEELQLNFDVNSIHLFSTEGDLKDWYRVGEFPLK